MPAPFPGLPVLGTWRNNHAPFPDMHWEPEEAEVRWEQL